MGRAKQEQVPGTETPTDPDMERAAEAYRQKVKERMELQATEASLKADLEAIVQKRIDTGAIQIPKGHTGPIEVYRYTDDEDTERAVKVDIGMSVKVNVAKGEK